MISGSHYREADIQPGVTVLPPGCTSGCATATDEHGHGLIYTAGNAGNGSNPQPNGVILGAGDGTVTVWAVTSTVSGSGDQGADPNQLVSISDRPAATTPGHDQFATVSPARYGQVVRGVSFTPKR